MKGHAPIKQFIDRSIRIAVWASKRNKRGMKLPYTLSIEKVWLDKKRRKLISRAARICIMPEELLSVHSVLMKYFDWKLKRFPKNAKPNRFPLKCFHTKSWNLAVWKNKKVSSAKSGHKCLSFTLQKQHRHRAKRWHKHTEYPTLEKPYKYENIYMWEAELLMLNKVLMKFFVWNKYKLITKEQLNDYSKILRKFK